MSEQRLWIVEIPEHEVFSTKRGYEVEECSYKVSGATAEDARVKACRYAHIDTGIPPWRPYLAVTTRLARVREDPADREMRERRAKAVGR